MVKIQKIIEFGFYLFIFLLPWQTRLIWQEAYLNGFVWEYGRFSLYGTEIILWLIILFWGFSLFKNFFWEKISWSELIIQLKKPQVLIYWLIILFLFSAILSGFWALDGRLAFFRAFVLIEAVALFSLVLNFKISFKKLAICWVASATIQSVFAIWQFFNQFVFANKWLGLAEHLSTVSGSIILQTVSERWLRAYGSLPHPNILGGFLAISLLFLLYLAFIAQTRNQRFFVLTSLVVIMPALFFSFSRSAWLALIFSLLILSFWLLKNKNYLWHKPFIKIFLLMVLMVVILGINLKNPLLTRILGREPAEITSIQLRLTFTEQAIELIKKNPWAGTGIGNYTLGVFRQINSFWPGWAYQPVHNIYFLVLAESGVFGALLFYLILILLIRGLKKSPAPPLPINHLEKIIVSLALFSILIISFFDHYFWTLYFGVIMFWLILALNLKQLIPQNKSSITP